jgi:hypothetical protein
MIATPDIRYGNLLPDMIIRLGAVSKIRISGPVEFLFSRSQHQRFTLIRVLLNCVSEPASFLRSADREIHNKQ